MNKVGLLISDLSGFYVLRQIREKRFDLDIDILYDPIGYFESRDEAYVRSYIERNKERFSHLDIENPIVLHENWTTELAHWESYVEQVEEVQKGKKLLRLKSQGQGNILSSPLLFRTVEDGLLQRNYTLFILEEYLNQVEGDWDGLILASPGYGFWKKEILIWTNNKKMSLFDPVDSILNGFKGLGQGKGQVRFFWTKRDFDFERRAREILQEEICFKTYYSHPWLRGEGRKKKPGFRDRLEEIRERRV